MTTSVWSQQISVLVVSAHATEPPHAHGQCTAVHRAVRARTTL